MNKTINLLVLLFLLFSCQKEEITYTELPAWLLPQIEQLEKSGQCFDCSVTKIIYNGNFYYHLYCGYWSCMYCNLFDSMGNPVEWKEGEFADFLENKTGETVIWTCDANSD